MGLFDISIKKELPSTLSKQEFLEELKTSLIQDKEYETKLDKSSLEIEKLHLDTLLKYNCKITLEKQKKATSFHLEGQLHDTLVLTILIILAILLTYGIGVVLVILYTYLQKKKATKFINEVLDKYETIKKSN